MKKKKFNFAKINSILEILVYVGIPITSVYIFGFYNIGIFILFLSGISFISTISIFFFDKSPGNFNGMFLIVPLFIALLSTPFFLIDYLLK